MREYWRVLEREVDEDAKERAGLRPAPTEQMDPAVAQFPALREWSSTCEAIARGEQILLIRKGGILEGSEGFTVESKRFALIPTVFHQAPGTASPDRFLISVVCDLLMAVEVPSIISMDRLARFHQYESQQLATRVRYKPEKPLTLMAIRSYHLRTPREFSSDVIRPVCRSWMELPTVIGDEDVTPISTKLNQLELLAELSRLQEKP